MTPIWHDESHGLGWVPERAPERVLGRLRSVPWELSFKDATSTNPLRDPLPGQQGDAESCTGFGVVGATYQATGQRYSPWYLWQMAVAYFRRLRTDGGVVNTGVRFSDVMRSIDNHGALPHALWGETSELFEKFRIPPAMKRGEAHRVTIDAVAVFGAGQRMVDVTVDALARGYGVALTVQVDRDFERPGGSLVGPRNGASLGGHMIHAHRVQTVGGVREIVCVNSWGKRWNGDGTVRLSEERIAESPYLAIVKGVHAL
jgi:hypothetical protein